MEASGVVQGSQTDGGENTDAPEGGEGGQRTDTTSSVDRLTERLDKFLEHVAPTDDDDGSLFEFTDEFDEFLDDDDDDTDDNFDDDETLTPEQEAERLLNEYVDQRVQERLDPILESQREEQRQEDLQALESRYPELATRDVAAPVLRHAMHIAQALGTPELAFEAPFLETVYLRSRAERAAAAEGSDESARGSETPLERAGSASGGGGEVDLADEIVKAKKGGAGRSFLIG